MEASGAHCYEGKHDGLYVLSPSLCVKLLWLLLTALHPPSQAMFLATGMLRTGSSRCIAYCVSKDECDLLAAAFNEVFPPVVLSKASTVTALLAN